MGALFSWVNAIDGAILAAGAQASGLPVANLADARVQKPWRSGTSTSTYFTADLRAGVALGVIGLFGCSLASTDTVRIRLSNVALGNGELLDTTALASGVVDGYGQYVYVPVAPITAQYLRVDINAASRASLGYFDIGRAWAGVVWAPGITFSLPWGEQWHDESTVLKSRRSGATFVDPQPPYRSLDVAFDWLSAADKLQAMELDRAAGRRGQILFVPDSTGDLARGPLLGRQREIGGVSQKQNFYPAAYSKPLTLVQDL